MVDELKRRFGPQVIAVGLAFAAVYLIWGSTYLAIRFAIETLPPFLMAGTRFAAAGAVLYAYTRWRGLPAPERAHWPAAIVIGGLLLLGGNGLLVWAETRVPSGIAALLIATVPLWMVLLEAWRRDGTRPGAATVAGLTAGFAGIVLLVGPGEFAGGGGVDLLGAGALTIASISWAFGSLYSRRANLPASPLVGISMEMLAGGAWLLLAGTLAGEWGRVDPGAVSPRSATALLYLTVFGSLVGFSSYIWLLRVSTPARVSTYAYVNPVVALFLGWALAGESLTPRTGLAVALVLAAV
ncbi:MAG: EamA family transporter, partial [Gemmatimonadota bacterium]